MCKCNYVTIVASNIVLCMYLLTIVYRDFHHSEPQELTIKESVGCFLAAIDGSLRIEYKDTTIRYPLNIRTLQLGIHFSMGYLDIHLDTKQKLTQHDLN